MSGLIKNIAKLIIQHVGTIEEIECDDCGASVCNECIYSE